jgi:hypothetical protein
MNKRHVLLAILILIGTVAILPAQDQQSGEEDTLQVVTVYVQRVYPHPQGYKVIYNRSDLYPGELYLPGRWFRAAGGKGEILYTDHPSAPYMMVYYLNGEFSHVRLFTQRNPSHPTWGALPGNEDLTEEFSIEVLEVDY